VTSGMRSLALACVRGVHSVMRRRTGGKPPTYILVVALASACLDEPPTFETCFDPSAEVSPSGSAVTYFAHVKPLLDQKCVRCHEPGAIGGFSLDTFDSASVMANAIAVETSARRMPPFQAASCCNEYRDDFSLTDDEIATLLRWADDGAPPGDVDDEPAARPRIGGLSRVDALVESAAPYVVSPAPGRTDDFRCFVLPIALDDDAFVTGLNPVPSNREVVHHISVGLVEGVELDEALALEAEDELPGFACEGGVGSVRLTGFLGGSLLGSDFPDGFGRPITAGSAILANVHYSLAHITGDDVSDQIAIELKLDDDARQMRNMAISNPAWLIGDAMRIDAEADDAVFRVALEPRLYTGTNSVDILGVTPHMHAYGTFVGVSIIRADASAPQQECLLEIPRWDFGWEQPYWFVEPIRMNAGDEVLLECHFDNGPSIGPDGAPQDARDIAWGEGDQDMCAAFLIFADVNE
jgi:hypothetical protein